MLRGFQTTTATILGGISAKAGQSGFLKQAYELASNLASDTKILDNARNILSGAGTAAEAAGSKLLALLFGGKESTVSEKIGAVSGLNPSSASRLMSLAAPAVLGMLGTRVMEDRLDVSGLSSLLQRELPSIRSFVPASLASLVGLAPSALRANVAQSVETERPMGRWVWPLVALLAAAGLLWLLTRSRDVAPVSQIRSSAASLGDFFRTTLVNGVSLNIPRNGIEARLLQFIQDPSRAADKTTWFDFDRLSFDTNSATLRADSQEQLGNIAAILKAYPALHIMIGGYTDSTGDAAANLQLSQARASSVRQQLVNTGIDPGRIEAEGYGDQFPVADNATEEGRARNRRISLRVTHK